MPSHEAPSEELGSAPQETIVISPSPSEISTASSPEHQPIRATPLFRALAMPPPEPEQPIGQDELERRLPGYQRIVIPRELSLIELLKQSSGVSTNEEVLQMREAKLRVVAERVGLRRLNVLAPRLRSLTLDGSALTSLRELGIGLVHLKVLSVNRCGLTSLDGVWGLGSLRELSVAGNRLQDLQPLAALQKLHTLNLSDNPIPDVGRLWTLGICSLLRRLTLAGTAAADSPHYRTEVAGALPMLVYLDDRPLHTDVEDDSDGLFGMEMSDSGESDEDGPDKAEPTEVPSFESEPGPSTDQKWDYISPGRIPAGAGDGTRRRRRRRPATTECAGARPDRPLQRPRPNTAVERYTAAAPTKLHLMNTLLDDEWRCSGSDLTSQSAVCGNLARALRRSRHQNLDAEKELLHSTLHDATRSLAAEIPRAPKAEDWLKFKKETGIEIEIDFKEREPDSVSGDAAKAIERLERIERETFERFKNGESSQVTTSAPPNFVSIMSDFESWKLENVPAEAMHFHRPVGSECSDVSESRSD